LTLRPGSRALATDACVPISRLAECVTETVADVAASRFQKNIFLGELRELPRDNFLINPCRLNKNISCAK
jgi:hypothetical protein